MKTYKVKASFIFTGVFEVKADTKEEAKAAVLNDCGMTISGGIHSTLDDNTINWDFPVHPEKEIYSIK